MRPKELIKRSDFGTCWWCGSSELTREHKFKKKDLERLYGSGKRFEKQDVSIIDYRSNKPPKKLQSAKSVFAQFEKSLCASCNNSKSQLFDFAYDQLIEYYLENENLIISNKKIDFFTIYGENWEVRKENFLKYIIKHVGCRLSEFGFLPFQSTIEYLNGSAPQKHLKVIIQIKPYSTFDIPILYKGPLIPISHNIDKKIITAVCGWFTVKNISFNYIYEWNISTSNKNFHRRTSVEIVDYSAFSYQSSYINADSLPTDFGNLIEKLEFFPFIAHRDEIEIYNYIREKKIT